MARPPKTDPNAPQKPFIVEEGFRIADLNEAQVMRTEGEQIMLTQAQATYYQKLGAITFDMGAVFDEPTTNPKPPSDTEAEGSTAKSGSKPKAEGERAIPVRGLPKSSVQED